MSNDILAGPKILIMGPAGTGKTHSIGTLVDWASHHSREVFVFFTESGLESLLGYWKDRGLEIPPNLHWHVGTVKPLSLSALKKAADQVGKLSYEGVTKIQDPTRSQNNEFYRVLDVCANFPDDRTGELYGPIDEWDTSRIFVLDSLSELSNAAMKMVIGNKPTAAPPEYLVAQNNLLNFLRLLTQGVKSTVVLTAHVTRETDEISGMTKLMVKSVGKALSNELPQLFSDVIYAVREGLSFYFDTAAVNVDVKTRNLPIASKQKPDFGVLMDKWTLRGGV